MPLSLDPDKTIGVWLDHDADKPADSRPTFKSRFMSFKERGHLLDLSQEAADVKDNPARARDLLTEALAIPVVGWQNMGDTAFARDAFDAVLTLQEMYDLTQVCLRETRIHEGDVKNSSTPRPSVGAESAADAPKHTVEVT